MHEKRFWGRCWDREIPQPIEIIKKESRTVKPIKGLTVRLFIMAERVGFEPTRPFGLTDFESAPL